MFLSLIQYISTVKFYLNKYNFVLYINQKLDINDVIYLNGVKLFVENINFNVHTKNFQISIFLNDNIIKNTTFKFEPLILNIEHPFKIKNNYFFNFQGIIDTTGKIINIINNEYYTIKYDIKYIDFIKNRNYICIDGAKIKINNYNLDTFTIYVLPYLFNNTIIKYYKINTFVNLEFMKKL